MTFRSPPPHRRSSGSSGGNEFERTQRDLAALVHKVGFDDLPLNDDTLRPFLLLLWDFCQRHQERLWTFDLASGATAGRLYHGLAKATWCRSRSLHTKLIDRELTEKFPLAEIRRAKPIFTIGNPSVVYFEGVWTPAAALASRRH